VLGVTLHSVEVSRPNEFKSALAALIRERPNALIMTADLMHQLRVRQIIDFAAKKRLPVMSKAQVFRFFAVNRAILICNDYIWWNEAKYTPGGSQDGTDRYGA
jgi:hypothetical protein